jgi:GAF domain-containing protein
MTATSDNAAADPQQIIAELQRKLDERAAELNESIAQQAAMAEILKVIASSPSDVQPVFDVIVERAVRLLNGHSTAVWRFAEDVMHLVAFTSTDPAGDSILQKLSPMRLDQFPVFEVVRRGEVVQVEDTESTQFPISDDAAKRLRDVARARGYRSQLFAPLMNDNGTIGFIVVTRKDPGGYVPQHVQLLRTFADQAVIAIQNVRMFTEVQARTRDLSEALDQQTATSDVLKVISRSAFDLDTVLTTLLESACQLCAAANASLYLRDGALMRNRANANAPAEAEAFFRNNAIPPGRKTVVARVFLTGEVEHVADVIADPEYDFGSAPQLGNFRSVLGVPLLREGRVEGVFALARPEPGGFHSRQVELVRGFADQALIAIENVRLFDEVQAKTRDLSEALQQQTATAEVLKVISRSAFDLQAVLDTLVQSATHICEADHGIIVQPKNDTYRLVASWGLTPSHQAFLQNHVFRPQDGSITSRALVEHKIIHVHDILDTPYGIQGDPNPARTRLAVPLLREGTSIGIFVLTRQESRPFTHKQIELVQTFADQAVIAIENVRLFYEVQARTKELAASLDDLRAAQDRLVQTEKLASLGQLTAGIAHEIKNPLNFVNNFSALSAELTDELNDLLKSAALGEKLREEVNELTRLLKDNLEKVVQHGKRADSIVKNMLLHSREGSGDHRPADINALVDESLNLAYHGARAEKPNFNVTLQRDFDPAAGMVEVFPQEITRAFLNLISNGFYATAKRKAEAGDGFEPVLRATTKSLGNKVEIRIRDNGTGIPPEVKEKMFNPFFTTKPAGEGTGLGLSMSHDIVVKQHGGKIEVETGFGEFTEFIITLPRTGTLQDGKRAQS